MSERKSLQRYFPPDFDPSKLKRIKSGKAAHTVRLMTPFSMRCNTCGEFIYRRKKFNAKKEKVLDEDYLGLPIYRFYIKCPVCLSTITFKTDPQNTDYTCENGAQRNFEPWRDEKFLGKDLLKEAEAEDAANPMKALERRTLESKREMDIMDALDEIKTKNMQMEMLDSDIVLQKKLVDRSDEIKAAEVEENSYIKSLFYASDGNAVRRILDDIIEIADDDDRNDGEDDKPTTTTTDSAATDTVTSSASLKASTATTTTAASAALSSRSPFFAPMKLGIKRKASSGPPVEPVEKPSSIALCNYCSDSD